MLYEILFDMHQNKNKHYVYSIALKWMLNIVLNEAKLAV